MITVNGTKITPTIFPDKTSQLWNLSYSCAPLNYDIIWEFEEEAEFLHLTQLLALLRSDRTLGVDEINLTIPFLPYARQDKPINNRSCFALKPFVDLLEHVRAKYGVSKVEVVDVHNPASIPKNWVNDMETPNNLIASIIKENSIDLVCFPDAGASKRGYKVSVPSFSLDKKRNQSTGVIEGLICPLPLDLKGKNVLLCDDLADGGKTFIEAAKLLYSMGTSEVQLYTTHGLYTKGTQVLKDAGIIKIFNRNGEVK